MIHTKEGDIEMHGDGFELLADLAVIASQMYVSFATDENADESKVRELIAKVMRRAFEKGLQNGIDEVEGKVNSEYAQ